MTAPSRPPGPRWGLRLATGLSLALLVLGGAGHLLLGTLGHKIDRVDAFDGLDNRPQQHGRGMNFLLAGVDRRDSVTAAEKAKYRLGGAPCNCTDTLMLVHVSGDRRRASVISIPRDTYVKFPPHTNHDLGEELAAHPGKLNSAYGHGGPPLTIRSVERLTGVHIDHYLEIDFSAFMKTVDVIGGVDVCTARPLKDSHSGLDLPAGTSTLKGGEALQYVRARHVDGASDLSRMKRQQRFMAAVIAKLSGTGGLLNPAKFREVSSTVLGSVRADAGFSSESMVSLGEAMRDFSPKSSEFATVPIADENFQVPEVGETVKWDTKKADNLFAKIRADEPLLMQRPKGPQPRLVEVPPQQIQVAVRNGTGRSGLAGKAVADLTKAGFIAGPPDNADADEKRTVISYDPAHDQSARSLQAALPGSVLREEPGQGPVMQVTLGKNFKKVAPVRPADPVLDAEAFGEFSAVSGDQVTCK
ncbi:LCP family protein [Streptomyces sp. A7024]|uniref:LCP family protein n=1 Tax=Streptomyces coryli TaxID=1128680 RepID=A0A6G4TZX8_9ACTN|nr:LCP family protein [Streptomyces coryli]NGN65383.1 LCP family protein [Streptomyces coryli]